MNLDFRQKIVFSIVCISLIPLLMLVLANANSLVDFSNSKQEVETLLLSNVNQSLAHIEQAVIRNVDRVAKDTAKQIELHLRIPGATINDASFREIAVQRLQHEGYTAVGDYLEFTILEHINPNLRGWAMDSVKDEQVDFYAIMNRIRNGTDSKGYYEWREADGRMRDKYMYVAIVPNSTLFVAATAYIDDIQQFSGSYLENSVSQIESIGLMYYEIKQRGLTNLLFGVLFSIIFILSLSLLSSVVITRPITKARAGLKHDIQESDDLEFVLKSLKILDTKLSDARNKLDSYDAKTKNEVRKQTKDMAKVIKELKDTKLAVMNMMEDVIESNEELKQLDEAKSNFLNMVSHELKTPLTAMTAHLEVLGDMNKDFNEQQLSSLTAIRRNSDQLRMLIENILEISRIESKKFDLNITKVDLNRQIRDAIANLRILAENKDIKLLSDATRLPLIHTDEARLKEILNNLISNAIKFTEKGKVTVRSSTKGKFVVIEVIDTGIGIPDEKMKDLFTKFYQVDASLSRRYGGTGLGLSITKQLVELQGGKIGVTSKPGKGSRFYVELPIRGVK